MEGLIVAPATDKYVLLLITLLLPALILLSRCRTKLKLPPGPCGLPFIGHLHLLGSSPHQSLCDLSKIHGPLMYLCFGSMPVVVASTPTMARQILQVHDKTFSFRPQPAVSTQLHNCTGIVFSQPRPYWKLVRQICLTDVFSNKRLESFQPLIADEVHALLCSILDTADEVPVRTKLHMATNNMISRMTLGKRLADLATHSQADPSYHLVSLLSESAELLSIFNVGDFIPCLAWMDLQGCARRSKALARKQHIVIQEVIDGRREMRRRSSHTAVEELDFLDVLITASQRKDVSITDFNISAILMDMFAAGIDTSTISTEWALCELIANPSKMKKVQDELESVVGISRLLRATDIPHLPYLCAVVKETLRLHPVAPLLAPHKAAHDCHISGYDIPLGTLAYVNVWAIGRDPTTWDQPLEFRPERFLDCDIDVRGKHFELLPFSSGRRACPGLTLGLTSVQYLLASIVHCFDWSMIDQPNMSEKFGIVMALEKPLVAKATLKVPKHLFA